MRSTRVSLLLIFPTWDILEWNEEYIMLNYMKIDLPIYNEL